MCNNNGGSKEGKVKKSNKRGGTYEKMNLS
jgi:hypothetical protein